MNQIFINTKLAAIYVLTPKKQSESKSMRYCTWRTKGPFLEKTPPFKTSNESNTSTKVVFFFGCECTFWFWCSLKSKWEKWSVPIWGVGICNGETKKFEWNYCGRSPSGPDGTLCRLTVLCRVQDFWGWDFGPARFWAVCNYYLKHSFCLQKHFFFF